MTKVAKIMSKNLTADLREYVRESLNAPTIGVAPVERFENAPSGHRPTDLLPGAKSVVAVPIPVLRSLLDLLARMEKAQT
jgi:epoxyqueuosine reductase QueG